MHIIPLKTCFWQTYYILGFWPNYDSYTSASSKFTGYEQYTRLKMKGQILPNYFSISLDFKSATLNLCRHNTDKSGLEDAVSTQIGLYLFHISDAWMKAKQ